MLFEFNPPSDSHASFGVASIFINPIGRQDPFLFEGRSVWVYVLHTYLVTEPSQQRGRNGEMRVRFALEKKNDELPSYIYNTLHNWHWHRIFIFPLPLSPLQRWKKFYLLVTDDEINSVDIRIDRPILYLHAMYMYMIRSNLPQVIMVLRAT